MKPAYAAQMRPGPALSLSLCACKQVGAIFLSVILRIAGSKPRSPRQHPSGRFPSASRIMSSLGATNALRIRSQNPVFARQSANGKCSCIHTHKVMMSSLGADYCGARHCLRSENCSCSYFKRTSLSSVVPCYGCDLSAANDESSPKENGSFTFARGELGPSAVQRGFDYGALRGDAHYQSYDIETGINWSSLSDDEFLARLEDLRLRSPDFCPSMLCGEEWLEFCKKRYAVVSKCAIEISRQIGNTDLVTPLLEYRVSQRGDAPSYKEEQKGR